MPCWSIQWGPNRKQEPFPGSHVSKLGPPGAQKGPGPKGQSLPAHPCNLHDQLRPTRCPRQNGQETPSQKNKRESLLGWHECTSSGVLGLPAEGGPRSALRRSSLAVNEKMIRETAVQIGMLWSSHRASLSITTLTYVSSSECVHGAVSYSSTLVVATFGPSRDCES